MIVIPETHCPFCNNKLLIRSGYLICGICIDDYLRSKYIVAYSNDLRKEIRYIRIFAGKWIVTNIFHIKETKVQRTNSFKETTLPLLKIDFANLQVLESRIDKIIIFS